MLKPIFPALFISIVCLSCGVSEKRPAEVYHFVEEFSPADKPHLALPDLEVAKLTTIVDSTLQSGLVTISVVISEQGKLSGFYVEKGLGAREDSVTVAKAKALPDFVPGKLKGKAVKVLYYVPFLIKGHGVDSTRTR